MGRELRRVPANWDHPKVMRHYGREDYQPMFDKRFEDAVSVWKEGFAKWESGERPDWAGDASKDAEFWEWEGGPPDREYFRPWSEADATWYQVWETVSEGTPVTPPFETKEELIEYLVENGDYWDQRRRKEGRNLAVDCDPWTKEAAERFVNGPGWAPSMVVSSKGVQSGVQSLADANNTPPDA